ncbi:MAG: DUF2442 domain-containing protein [Prevotellaceae bacterium]|jgi:hypothetical protein|nr:DUF2442 domain-containing protein [Prevotellaceae bacterium]
MNPRVLDVKPESEYMLKLYFANGEVRRFDVKPYLHYEVFRALQDVSVFNSVRPFLGSIQWSNRADLCPDTLYEDSEPVY